MDHCYNDKPGPNKQRWTYRGMTKQIWYEQHASAEHFANKYAKIIQIHFSTNKNLQDPTLESNSNS